MLEGFPLISRFTVPFSDVDMMRHVNNVSYIRWCEAIRAEYFAEVMKEPINGERGMIQANIQFTYERELHYREAVAIGIRVSRVGTKSWDFAYEIWSESDGVRVAHGTTTVVAYDFINRATIVIPQQWRDDIARYEAGPQRTYV
ncbi:MAG: acyl-CoA thioesterase [Candidatus Eremiobacteraeota bacterium]|nr:acyl-CoA thioesterase [Candidatus Eremiobacteraeota bacterium]